MKYFIRTFGCAANEADSERVAAMLEARGMTKASSMDKAGHVVINTCMVRRSAEDRAYGLIRNLRKVKSRQPDLKIVVTGCLVGAAAREKSGEMMRHLKEKWPEVDEWLPIEEVGFDFAPLRSNEGHALVTVSNGCNNFCTFCIVPFTRGREVSRPFKEVVTECKQLIKNGYKEITLVGQNVNSYGADLLVGGENIQTLRDLGRTYFESPPLVQGTGRDDYLRNQDEDRHRPIPARPWKGDGGKYKPVYIKHLGKFRLPTLFPQLLETVSVIPGLMRLDFISSNPWDFTDDLIEVMAKHQNIARQLHLPVQSGSNAVLKRMNRWYTRREYLELVSKLKTKISGITLSTDIIVGFPGETENQFNETVDLVKRAGFYKAYISRYSPRPGTAATTAFCDDVGHREKKRRWQVLENLINKPYLKKGSTPLNSRACSKP